MTALLLVRYQASRNQDRPPASTDRDVAPADRPGAALCGHHRLASRSPDAIRRLAVTALRRLRLLLMAMGNRRGALRTLS